MNQLELALANFKKERKGHKDSIINKYLDRGKHSLEKSEKVRFEYKSTHPKVLAATMKISCHEKPNKYAASNRLLTKIFSL